MFSPPVIAAIWAAVAVVALLLARRAGRDGLAACVTLTTCCASLHAWGWNRPLYQAGRQWLVDHELYAGRMWLKVTIGAVVVAGLLAAVRPAWRRLRGWPRARLVAFAAALLDVGYIGARTLSIDGWMPDAIAFEPGKGVLGFVLAAAALAATPFARRRRDAAPGEGGGVAFLGR
ncbi:MAG: hypothetical protein H6835_02705 [Planctomycetes bacterium]|nr:hypothetical protein [Planctomycetota bacterium]